jgi:S-adenosylhomocysteine hydrolase
VNRGGPARLETSLGPQLRFDAGVWNLAVDTLPVLHGLSVLSRALAEMVTAQMRSERLDIAVERRLRARENPELIDRFGIDSVKLAAEQAAIDAIAAQPERFETRLRAMLGSLQRQRYRDALLPAERTESRALVAEFGDASSRCRIVLEYVPMRRDTTRGSLRFTIEGATGRRLALDSLPHEWIADVEERHFIAGSTRISQTWTEALRREAERGRRSFFEQRDPHSHLFRQLDEAGLGAIHRVSLHWADDAVPILLESEPGEISEMLKRALLALEDRGVRRLLAEREVLRVDTGALPVFLDLTQLGRVLTISLGQRRERADADAFLQRMPALRAVIEASADLLPLRDVPVFLVHHMTAEVVGLIAALRALGCRDLCCLFITYAGEPPASYLDAILDLPVDEFRALALVNVPTRDRVGGHYRPSTHYSQLEEAADIAAALAGREERYLDAMRASVVVPFLRQIARAEAAGRRCLLIEDGAYLGPVLHDAMLRGVSVREFASELGHVCADVRPIADVLRTRLLGTVEHTRNGFDRLEEVEGRHGRLGLPAFSIAISRLKRVVEAREVAASILGAIEAVLNADGRTLARRSCLVLGSRGAIGSQLCRGLVQRLDCASVLGVDSRAGDAEVMAGCTEARSLAELPRDAWLGVDLVLGVTGASVLTGADLENWLLAGEASTLVLASGSTKKVEFHDLMTWFDGLLRSDAPRLGGFEIEVSIEELLDPRTARVYGHRWHFVFADGRAPKAVLALGGLTPINFLFYGVANEFIDDVLAQLLSTSLGLVSRAAAGGLAPRLYAVDRDIDAIGRPLSPPHS